MKVKVYVSMRRGVVKLGVPVSPEHEREYHYTGHCWIVGDYARRR